MMEIKLRKSGLDDALKDIQEDLENALNAKSKLNKNKLISKALGAVEAIFVMVDVCEEKESEND